MACYLPHFTLGCTIRLGRDGGFGTCNVNMVCEVVLYEGCFGPWISRGNELAFCVLYTLVLCVETPTFTYYEV